MDWIIAAAVGTASFGAFKILKDIFGDKKRPQMWIVISETVLICFILFSAINGQLNKIASDVESRDRLDKRLSGIPEHNDTSLSHAAGEIKRADSIEIDGLKDSVQNLKGVIQNQKQIIAAEKRPYIDITPIENVLNPLINVHGRNEDGIDTLNVKVEFINCGSSVAKNIHAKHLDFVVYPNLQFVVVDPFEIDSDSSTELRPVCEKLAYENNRALYIKYVPQSILVHYVAFCYSDTSGKRYGPYYRRFKWNVDNFGRGPTSLDRDLANLTDSIFKARKMWPEKFF